jgi:hypothetical protein
MIRHQHIGVDREGVACVVVKNLFEMVVVGVGKNSLALVAAQDDVLGYALGKVAGKSGYSRSLSELFCRV